MKLLHQHFFIQWNCTTILYPFWLCLYVFLSLILKHNRCARKKAKLCMLQLSFKANKVFFLIFWCFFMFFSSLFDVFFSIIQMQYKMQYKVLSDTLCISQSIKKTKHHASIQFGTISGTDWTSALFWFQIETETWIIFFVLTKCDAATTTK